MGLVGSLFGGGGGGGDLLGSLFGGSGPAGAQRPVIPPQQLQPQATRPAMRGPNMDDILNDINLQAILNPGNQGPSDHGQINHMSQMDRMDRMEMMSTVSESEISELQDTASVRGVVVRKSPGSGGKRASGGATAPRGAATANGITVNKKTTIDI